MKNGLYTRYQRLTKDKDRATAFYIDNMLQKTLSMFHYTGLPSTIPQNELENILQRFGYAIIAKVDGNLYALRGGLGGEQNAYYHPTVATVANPYLNLTKEYVIQDNKDAVLFKNDYLCQGLTPTIGRYAVPLIDANISLNAAAVLSRLQVVISASDDLTRKSADLYIEKLINGDFSVITENAFLSGVKVQNVDYPLIIKDLIELTQYYKSNLLAEIGINSQFNMKRERLTENEVLLNDNELMPFVENMLFERKTAVNAINEKYGTEISVDLKSVWKTAKEINDRAAAVEETETASETYETDETNGNENKQKQATEIASSANAASENSETDETDETDETEKIVKYIREMRETENARNENN